MKRAASGRQRRQRRWRVRDGVVTREELVGHGGVGMLFVTLLRPLARPVLRVLAPPSPWVRTGRSRVGDRLVVVVALAGRAVADGGQLRRGTRRVRNDRILLHKSTATATTTTIGGEHGTVSVGPR